MGARSTSCEGPLSDGCRCLVRMDMYRISLINFVRGSAQRILMSGYGGIIYLARARTSRFASAAHSAARDPSSRARASTTASIFACDAATAYAHATAAISPDLGG